MTCQAAERESLTFLAAGTLGPQERATALAHLQACASCGAEWPALSGLFSGLRELHLKTEEVVAAAADGRDPEHAALCQACRDEIADLRAVQASLRSSHGRGMLSPRWVASLAASLVVVLAGWLALRGPGGDKSAAPSGGNMRGGTLPPGPALEKLEVKLSAERALAYRGPGDRSSTFLDDLGAALQPYRSDDFGEAARRLGEVGAKHPRAVEPPLYQGVSLLLLDRPRDAIAPLERAFSLAGDGELRRDAEFHLAIARLRAGESGGREVLVRLCAEEGPYRAKACRAR
jgi:hypothetical protein